MVSSTCMVRHQFPRDLCTSVLLPSGNPRDRTIAANNSPGQLFERANSSLARPARHKILADQRICPCHASCLMPALSAASVGPSGRLAVLSPAARQLLSQGWEGASPVACWPQATMLVQNFGGCPCGLPRLQAATARARQLFATLPDQQVPPAAHRPPDGCMRPTHRRTISLGHRWMHGSCQEVPGQPKRGEATRHGSACAHSTASMPSSGSATVARASP